MTFLGVTEHFSGKNGALRWSSLVAKTSRFEKTRRAGWYRVKYRVSFTCFAR